MKIVVHAIFTQSTEFMAIRLSNYIHKSLFFILFFGIEAPQDFFVTISRWSIEIRWKKGNRLLSKFEIWWRFDFHYTNVFISLWQFLPSSQIYKCRVQCKNNSSEKKPQRENLVKSLVRARYGVHERSAKEFLKIFNWTYICSFSKVIVFLPNENALRRNCNWLLLTAHSRYSVVPLFFVNVIVFRISIPDGFEFYTFK